MTQLLQHRPIHVNSHSQPPVVSRSGELCCSVIDGNVDDAETSEKKSVANIIVYFMLLGSKPQAEILLYSLIHCLYSTTHPYRTS